MGPRSQYLETVLTCMGDYYSPDFHRQLSVFREQLQRLIFAGDERSLILKKVEPWNSVRVTFNIPADAAERLRELAQQSNSILRELGVLAVQIGGDSVMSLSVGGNGSSTDTKPSDVVAVNASQAICQPTASVVVSTSSQTTDPSAEQVLQQFKVPTLIVPSCCPSILPPASSAVRTAVAECSVPDVVSNLNVVQPRPVGLVRWPNVVPDAVAVRFAVPPVPMKEFSQGLCFISPLRAAVSQNIASSSPLLVNLLQARRQQGITAAQSQPVVPLDTSALILPQKRRRNTSARKAKQLRNEQEVSMSVSSLQLTENSTLHATRTQSFPVTTTFAAGFSMMSASDSQVAMETHNMTNESSSEDSGRARQMINPYTGNLELVDITEDDGLSVSVYPSTESSGSNSQPPIETTASRRTALLNSGQYVTISSLSNQILPNVMPSKLIPEAVKASELATCTASGGNLAKNKDIPCTENPTFSTSLVSMPTMSTSSRCVDWYTASQSDKHNRLQSDATQSLFAASVSGVKKPEVVESLGITIPSEKSVVGSDGTKAGTYSSAERYFSAVKPLCTSEQLAVSSVSKSSTVTTSCLESVRQISTCMSDVIPVQGSNFSTSCSSMPQLSSSHTDLIQMAFTLAKQNGSALHVSSLVDNWTKNAGLLQSSLQSLHGLHNIALTNTSIPLHSSSTAATTSSSCVQSKVKDVDGRASTTTVVSSDTCFFPAVSCFPPEHRRKSAVSIGGFGINPEPQLQTGTSGVASSLMSTLPAVKILTPSSMPLDVKTCGVSVAPCPVSNPVTVSASTNTESNLLSASTERAPLQNSDIKKSIPLLTNLAPTSWPLMPNLLTVPLVNPTPLSRSPLLHCVTRAPLTPDGKLAGLSAAVTNAKGNIVPLAGRFCIPLSSSQAASVTPVVDKQNTESMVVSGIRPHTIMLTDNLGKFKLSVSSNTGKSSGKHGLSKDRRGSTTRMDDSSSVQRGSGKSHLTVAQLLDMAKNARLQQTASDDDHAKSSELQNEASSSVVTSASPQPQSALTMSPMQLSSLPLQSSSVMLTSHDQSQAAQLVSMRLPGSSAGSMHVSPTASALLQTNANSVLSLTATTSIAVSQPAATTAAHALSPHPLAQPLNALTTFSTISAHSTAATSDGPGKASVESAATSEYVALNSLSSSVSASLPMSAYSVHPPLPITSPRYPLNLTESVKKAMRGVGLYPSPPLSPTAPLHTFSSLKLPEIRPYPVSIACSVPVSDLSTKKLILDRSTITVSATSQPQLLSASSTPAAASCINSCGQFTTSVNFASHQASTTANNCALNVCPTIACAEMAGNQLSAKNGDIVSSSGGADVHVDHTVRSISSVTATAVIPTCDSLCTGSQSSAVRSESLTTNYSAHVSCVVTCSVPKSQLLSSMPIETDSLQCRAVSSDNSLKDSVTDSVNCLNGRLSASSGDSDVELRRDILEGLSSVETDAGLSSLQSSPCSAELATVLDSTKEASTAVMHNARVMNCVTAADHRHDHEAVPLSDRLSVDSPIFEGSLSLQCDTTVEDEYVKDVSLASDVSAESVDVRDNQGISAAADSVDVLCQKAAADSSVTSSKYTLLKRNRLQTAASSIGVRSAARRKRPADKDTDTDAISVSSNSVKPTGKQQAVTSVGSVTRMKTRSSQRTSTSNTEPVNKNGDNHTKFAVQKTPVKSSEKRGRAASESPNHIPDLSATKSAVVTQRRSARTPVPKVMDFTKSEYVDSGVSLRSRRHTQKVNSVEAGTPKKRAGVRGTGAGKEVLCLVDSTEDVIGVLDGSPGIEVNVNDHQDDR